MPKFNRLAYEKTMKRRRELELAVLRYLKRQKKPVIWDTIHLRFERERPGEICPILEELKAGHYILVDKEKNVSISQVGLKRLADGMF